MKSPIRELRLRRGWTKQQLAKALETRTRIITEMEEGRKRVSDKFYRLFRRIGEDPFKLAVDQETFIDWRSQFYSSLRWGITPSNI